MSKVVIIACVIISSISAFSQSQSSSVISTAGMTSTNSSAIVSWSLGEVVVSISDIHQGYQFPSETMNLITAIEDHFQGKIKIFPNPTHDILTLTLSPSNDIIEINLLDVMGRKLDSLVPKDDHQLRMDLSGLNPGIYLLIISAEANRSRSYKIIKK